MTEIIYPIRISAASDGVKNVEALLTQHTLQVGLKEKKEDLAVIHGGQYVILDFGMEYSGGVRLLTLQGCPKVRLRLGESLAECSAELGQDGACNDHSLRDMVVELPTHSDSQYFKSAFRFLRIDNLTEKPLSLKQVVACYDHADIAQTGSFECNDELVNDIFKTSVRTLHLNLQNGVIYDGVKRDRLVWIGDLHPECLAYLGLYEDHSFLVNSLEFMIETTLIKDYMNTIPAYTAWFLIILHDYILHSGNVAFIQKHKDYILETIELMATAIGDDGVLTVPNNDIFFDWPSHNYEDKGFFGNVILWYYSLKLSLRLMELLGAENGHIKAKVDLIKSRYPDSCNYKQAAAMRIYTGLDQDPTVLTKGGSKGFSTFMSYYILDSIARTEGQATALELMKEYYGKMLELGATTFFEDFDIDWAANSARLDEYPADGQDEIHRCYGDFCYKGFRHSLCHGWSAGPVQYLQRAVAGINILDVGCTKVSVKPDLGSLDWMRCSFPTPKGIITVEADKNGTRISLPQGVQLVE